MNLASRVVQGVLISAVWGVTLTGALCSVSARADEAEPGVKLQRVVLFTSGVGFFEHTGKVTDQATLEIPFRSSSVNDLLKSLLVQDLGGGTATRVTYSANEPLPETLRSFAVNLEGEISLAEILEQFRGQKVTLDAPGVRPAQPKFEGTIVGIERRPVAVKDEILEIDVVILRTATGLRALALDKVDEVSLHDARLNAELQKALDALAGASRRDATPLKFEFKGKGQRPVRLAYIQETAVWKTGYRLEFRKGEDPILQGWAIVDNTTETDWNDVSLTLAANRPVSYFMELYQPRFVDRPIVEPSYFEGLTTRAHEQTLPGDLGRRQGRFGRGPGMVGGLGGGGYGGGGLGGNFGGLGGAPAGRQAGPFGREAPPHVDPKDIGKAAGTQVAPAEEGETFEYSLADTVTIGRRKSAMIPIVNEPVKVERLSLFNSESHPKHPLIGARIKNSTPRHLLHGPVTVFDHNRYAGEAQIATLAPRSERLITYALDTDVEVLSHPAEVVTKAQLVRIALGTAYSEDQFLRTRKFTIKNSSVEPRTLLVEWPREESWTVIAPQTGVESTRSLRRATLVLEGKKSAELEVIEEKRQQVEWTITETDVASLRRFATTSGGKKLTPFQPKLVELASKETAWQAAQQVRVALIAAIARIESDQKRVRETLTVITDKTDPLYGTFLRKLGDLEKSFETHREKLTTAEADEKATLKVFRDALMNWTLE